MVSRPFSRPEVGNVVARVERITREDAERLLAGMRRNRPLKKVPLRRYIQAMTEGVFDGLNGETLIINVRGELEDGQHRLVALIESGLPYMDFLVVRGAAVGAGNTVDQGTSRSPGDIAVMAGHESGRTLMAAARWLYIYEREWPAGLRTRASAVPTQTLIRFVDEHPDLERAQQDFRLNYMPVAKLTTMSVGIFTRYVTKRVDAGLSDEFFSALTLGETTARTRQTRLLRDRLLIRNTKAGRLKAQEIVIVVARVWNAVRDDRSLTKLYISKYDDLKRAVVQAPRFK